MTSNLTTRDGLVGNSPRYTGYISPPYQRFLKDDSGAAINLTNVAASSLGLTMVNQSNPLLVKTGGGTWTIPSTTAAQGLVSYQYAFEDLADAGNWYLFVTVKLPGETGQRAFDPDFLHIELFPGGLPIVTIQDINLNEVNGAILSPSNPVPISGSVSIPDGSNVAQGSTTDSSSASTTIGLLKAIKAYLSGTLATSLSGGVTETNSAAILADAASLVASSNTLVAATGTVGDAAWSGSGNGTEIALLKKLVAELAATLNISGTVTANAGTNLNTSLLALESGNLASAKIDLDTLVPGIQGWIAATGTGTASQDNTLTFSQQVRKVYLHNASNVNVPFEFDTASTANSDFIEPGQRLVFDNVLCTSVHVFPSALLPINTANGLYVKGWK